MKLSLNKEWFENRIQPNENYEVGVGIPSGTAGRMGNKNEITVTHVCRKSNECCCYQLALEPDENCPVHGIGERFPKCEVCGQFMRRIPQPPAVEGE